MVYLKEINALAIFLCFKKYNSYGAQVGKALVDVSQANLGSLKEQSTEL